MMRRSVPLSLLAVFLSQFISSCIAYPIIFEAVHSDRTCIDLNVPDGDDGHILLLPMPENIDDELEDWYVTEFGEMVRPESVHFLKDIAKPPTEIKKKMSALTSRSKVTVTIQEDDERQTTKSQHLRYWEPTIIRNISGHSKGWNSNRGNFRMCVTARGAADVRVIFDTIRISEYEEKIHRRHVVRKDHLSPLERAFDESVGIAKTIIDEMHYMEKREVRMKKTADATNKMVRYFSYISISILLGVTYVQISYLKSYFKKKKVL